MSTIYSINFATQPDQNPLVDGSNWSQTLFLSTPLQILGGVCEGTTAGAGTGSGGAALRGPTFVQNDQWAQFVLGSLTSSDNVGHTSRIQIAIRATDGSSVNGRTVFTLQSSGAWSISEVIGGSATLIASGTTTFTSGDLFTIYRSAAPDATIYAYQNATLLASVSDVVSSVNSTPYVSLACQITVSSATLTAYAAGSGAPPLGAHIISGNAGVASALVSWSGDASGSTTADGSGDYTTDPLANGDYTITPSLDGYNFTPTSQDETISGADIANVDFIATAGPSPHGWSPVDSRVEPNGPNAGVVQESGAVFYTGQTSSNESVPGVDSRVNVPEDSRLEENIPVNSRVQP